MALTNENGHVGARSQQCCQWPDLGGGPGNLGMGQGSGQEISSIYRVFLASDKFKVTVKFGTQLVLLPVCRCWSLRLPEASSVVLHLAWILLLLLLLL